MRRDLTTKMLVAFKAGARGIENIQPQGKTKKLILTHQVVARSVRGQKNDLPA